ncbi:MAG: hypothetical protein NE334_20735 [Lentisphaeraceae bacterium]|nr:hypothetical protein [Lentisphaeraceae bacterium]
MNGKQTDTGETPLDTVKKIEVDNPNSINCTECGRAISQKSGKCYYCSEADPEAIKKLSFVMLDWQQEAALDTDSRASESAQKKLSVLFMVNAALCLLFAMTGIASTLYPIYIFILLSAVLGVLGWCFYFNSLTLFLAAAGQAASFIFFSYLSTRFIPDNYTKAAFCSVSSSISFISLAIITYRIIKNKAIEL